MKLGKNNFGLSGKVKELKDDFGDNLDDIKDAGKRKYDSVKRTVTGTSGRRNDKGRANYSRASEDSYVPNASRRGSTRSRRDTASPRRSTSSTGTKFCTLCGSPMETGNRFCLNCGADMGSMRNQSMNVNPSRYAVDPNSGFITSDTSYGAGSVLSTDSISSDRPASVVDTISNSRISRTQSPELDGASRARDTRQRISRSNNTGRQRTSGKRKVASGKLSGNRTIIDDLFGNGQSKILVIAGAGACVLFLLIASVVGLASSPGGSSKKSEESFSESQIEAEEDVSIERSLTSTADEEEPETESPTVASDDSALKAEASNATAVSETTADSSTENVATANSDTSDAGTTGTTEKSADEKVIAIDKVRVRKQPNTDSDADIIDTIAIGTKLYRYEAMDDGWSRVKYNDQDAYVKTEYLATESEYASLKKKEEEDKAKAETDSAATTTADTAQNATTEVAQTTADTSQADAAAAALATQSTGATPTSSTPATSGTVGQGTGSYIVNAKDSKHKVHRSTCPTLPAEGNRIYFNSLDEVRAAGYYDDCGNCMK